MSDLPPQQSHLWREGETPSRIQAKDGVTTTPRAGHSLVLPSGITPYYHDSKSGIVIFNADCRDVLPQLNREDLAAMVTDPPYGLGHISGRSVHMWGALANYHCRITNDYDTSLRDMAIDWAGNLPCLIFGTWKRPRPAATRSVLIWDKGENAGMGDLSIPWKPSHEEIYVLGSGFYGYRGGGVLRAYVPCRVSMGRIHPTEKPVNLLQQLLEKCPEGVILDPFMGSGTTLVAAKQLGRRAIGIELSRTYCDIAIERLRQDVMTFETAE